MAKEQPAAHEDGGEQPILDRAELRSPLVARVDGPSLLPGHGDPEAFLRIDEVVMIILAKIELHPVDLACEPAVARGVVGRHRGTGLIADVGRLVG